MKDIINFFKWIIKLVIIAIAVYFIFPVVKPHVISFYNESTKSSKNTPEITKDESPKSPNYQKPNSNNSEFVFKADTTWRGMVNDEGESVLFRDSVDATGKIFYQVFCYPDGKKACEPKIAYVKD